MRVTAAALALTLLSAPAAALPRGSPAPATPTDVDRFNGPSPGDIPPGTGLPLQRTAIERLRQVCGSSSLRDRRTCTRAWSEINAAYAQIRAGAVTRD